MLNSSKERVLVVTTILSTLVYLIWRVFFTLPIGYGILSVIFGVILLVAEFTGVFEEIIHFYHMADKKRPKLPKVDEEKFPTVDVLIATYNEPVELLYKTVNGCVNMQYPDKEKVKIFLCDDGGREEMKKLAEHFQIGYFAREDREGAKAGNLNHALKRTKGELVVTFDADMIPMSDFLMATVPYFIAEKKVGFIQMPQSFYNLDLFQYNLYSEHTIPNEQDYFYKDIQLAKNKTNSVIYGGSNTVIARKALDEIGGFVTNVITEDFATGMLIQSKGYSCYATDEVHASGLSPEDLESLISQRRRWARGCIQTGRKLNILFQKGLSVKQKISYLNSIVYWYSCVKRFVYCLAPLVYSVFGVTVLVASPITLLLFWLPMYVLNSKTLKWLSGNIRTTRWTNIYETILFPLLLKDVLLEMCGISLKKFQVTRKGNPSQKTKYRKYAIPHVILAILSIIGIANCIRRIFETGDVSLLYLVFWLLLNLYNYVMAILFMAGRTSRRKYERFQIDAEVSVAYEERVFQGKIYDICEGGFSMHLKYPEYLPPEELGKVRIDDGRYVFHGTAKIVQVLEEEEGYKYAFSFQKMNEDEYRILLHILHDRVPPRTQEIKKEYGFMEDLYINLSRRPEKTKGYKRKLPRIPVQRELVCENGTEVRVLNFNYEYMALQGMSEHAHRMLFKLRNDCKVLVEYVKELSNYEVSEAAGFYGMAKLYRIVNLEEIIHDEQFPALLYQVQKRHEKQLESTLETKRKAQIEVEYDEMEWL